MPQCLCGVHWVLEEKLWVDFIRQTATSLVRSIPERDSQFENWDNYQQRCLLVRNVAYRSD